MTGDGRSPGGLILPGSAEFMAFDAPPAPGGHPQDETETETQDAPETRLPPGAVDCAVEIFGPVDRFPPAPWPGDADGPPAPAEHSADSYLGRPHADRAVLCQPAAYGFDPACLLAGLAALPAAVAVTVAAPEVSDSELGDLADAGCRGLRFQMAPEPHRLAWTDLDRLAGRAHDLEWHVELRMDGRFLHAVEPRLRAWPGLLVIENFGHFLGPIGPKEEGVRALLRLIDGGRTWVKLDRPSALSRIGPPRFDDVAEIARLLVDWAPERLVWGGDGGADGPAAGPAWSALAEWCDSDKILAQVLVDNPETLYRLPPWPAEDASAAPSES